MKLRVIAPKDVPGPSLDGKLPLPLSTSMETMAAVEGSLRPGEPVGGEPNDRDAPPSNRRGFASASAERSSLAKRKLSNRLAGLPEAVKDAVDALRTRPLTPAELGALERSLGGLRMGDRKRAIEGAHHLLGGLRGWRECHRRPTAQRVFALFTAASFSARFEERLSRLSPAHQVETRLFVRDLNEAIGAKLVTEAEAAIVAEHVIELGERGRNASNTGNLRDLFVHTLRETRDPVRAFAQVLADSVKVVPMPDDAQLEPPLRVIYGSRTGPIERISDLPVPAFVKMLVAHTAVAYSDPRMAEAMRAMIRATHQDASPPEVERRLGEAALQSQHLPSSSFVMSFGSGMKLDVLAMKGVSLPPEDRALFAALFEVAAEFDPTWLKAFKRGEAPRGHRFEQWQARYRAAVDGLPGEVGDALRYQLATDTLTNFCEGTMSSGKWFDAVVRFEGARTRAEAIAGVARIVRQYQAEWTILHGRPLEEMNATVGPVLARYGIGFDEQGLAELRTDSPELRRAIDTQIERAFAALR
jgi:hypothetical protein